jgi:hypothetical protein
MIGRIGRNLIAGDGGIPNCVATIYANGNDIRKSVSLERELAAFVLGLGKSCVREAFLKHLTAKRSLTSDVLRPEGFRLPHQCCSVCRSVCDCIQCSGGLDTVEEKCDDLAASEQELHEDDASQQGPGADGWSVGEYIAGEYESIL